MATKTPEPRKGMPDPKLTHAEFSARHLHQVTDPALRPLDAELDRDIGYWRPYATSHEDLDADTAVQEEVKNAARALLEGVTAGRAGLLAAAGMDLEQPRKK